MHLYNLILKCNLKIPWKTTKRMDYDCIWMGKFQLIGFNKENPRYMECLSPLDSKLSK